MYDRPLARVQSCTDGRTHGRSVSPSVSDIGTVHRNIGQYKILNRPRAECFCTTTYCPSGKITRLHRCIKPRPPHASRIKEQNEQKGHEPPFKIGNTTPPRGSASSAVLACRRCRPCLCVRPLSLSRKVRHIATLRLAQSRAAIESYLEPHRCSDGAQPVPLQWEPWHSAAVAQRRHALFSF
jgi:hypothetical protein